MAEFDPKLIFKLLSKTHKIHPPTTLVSHDNHELELLLARP